MTEQVFGVPMTSHTMNELVDEICAHSDRHGRRMIFTMNLDHVVQMRRNQQFKEAYRKADIVTADGMPVLVYAKLKGVMVEKITGSDLFTLVMPKLSPTKHRCFFVLSNEQLGHMMRRRMVEHGFSREQVDWMVPPFGFEQDKRVSAHLAKMIQRLRPTHIFFCLGAPKSEIWCGHHPEALGRAVVMCVGASAEFYLGSKRRAPKVFQRVGMEWLWRWVQEPRRLSRRYFVQSWAFVAAVWDDYRAG
jgi:N-acetylglucosaminyldiphosphoundecaprenol N-acetyl-beta-D-mannosaminyltransferase